MLRGALLTPACVAVVIAHNHPSENPVPSQADRDLTRAMRAACEAVGLAFVDHVVVTERSFQQAL